MPVVSLVVLSFGLSVVHTATAPENVSGCRVGAAYILESALVQFDDVRSSGRVWHELPSDLVALPAATGTSSDLHTVSLVTLTVLL